MDFSQLDKPIQFLKGVGPKRAEAFGRMGIPTARHLLYHVPRRYDDASTVSPISSLDVGMDATAVGTVRSKGILPTRSGLRIFQAVLQDETGMITCAWPGQPWLDRRIRKGDTLLVTGPVKFFHGRQLHPREFTLMGREGQGEGEGEPVNAGTIFVDRLHLRNQDSTLKAAGSIQMLVPGTLWAEYHKEVGKIMTGELKGLGLLDKADVQNENPDWPAYKKYFMHGTSHHIGLDTHDYGALKTPMKPNMVFTVEPGIYIPEEGFGIRLEDDVVIQEKGEPVNLMKNIPIEAEAIEELMNP